MLTSHFFLSLTLIGSFTNQRMWYKKNGIAARKLLPQHYQKLFANKQIVCVEYENLTPDQEREIFQVLYSPIHGGMLLNQLVQSVYNSA